jgi:hypothetical protein
MKKGLFIVKEIMITLTYGLCHYVNIMSYATLPLGGGGHS